MIRSIISLAFIFSAGLASAQVPSLAGMGYAVSNGNHPQPANFANDMRRGIQMTKADHGCSWAVRSLIYVFSDVVVYANPGGTDYNSFDLGTVRSKGCKLPDAVQNVSTPGNSSQLPKLRDLGWPVDNSNHAMPGDFYNVMGRGMKITQQQHQCSWATRPQIWVFADAVVYANNGGKDYNVFDLATVQSKGCVIPGASSSGKKTLASMGYAVDNTGHKRPANFVADMSHGIQMTQSEHKCSWAVRPLIYVFPDGVVYANNSGDDYNVFDISTVKSKGCVLPSSSTTAPAPKDKTLDDDMLAIIGKYNNNMSNYQSFVGSPIEMQMPSLTISEDASNAVSVFVPQDPDQLMSNMVGFTAMPSASDGAAPTAYMPSMNNGQYTEPSGMADSISSFVPTIGPIGLPGVTPPAGPLRPGGPVKPIFTIPAPKTISNSHKWVANANYEAGYRYDYAYYPNTGSLLLSGNAAIYGRILSTQADMVGVSARTERDYNGTFDNVNDDKLAVTVDGKIYTKTYTIYNDKVSNIDKDVVIEGQKYRTNLWTTFYNFAIGPVPFTATLELNAAAGWEKGSYGWGAKTRLVVPKASIDFTPSGRFFVSGKLEPGVTQLNRYLAALGASTSSVGAAVDMNLADGQLKMWGYIMPNSYCRSVRLQNMSSLNGRMYGYIKAKVPVVKVVNEVIGTLCKYDIFGVCKSKAVQTIQKKVNEISELNIERDWYKFPGYKFPDYDVSTGCSKF
jgi:hypothetical protein